MKIGSKLVSLVVAVLPAALFVSLAQSQATDAPSFPQHIQPIFTAHCSPCHTGENSSGGLSLASFESLKKGTVVVAGNADKSVLLDRILGKGGLPRMPMGFKPLSDKDVALIRDWINAGALNSATLKRHWAFVLPKKAKMPIGASPIDHYVLARLKLEGLKPSSEADRTTLIRRLSLDLIGLPPTPSEVAQFLADKSAKAYEKVVDRLLSSPHYGERMALPWLDAARYADSNGFQQDGDTYQYVWRDWVVRALNANMPFDQFTIEQLAGDLLPKPSLDQLVATAFNRNHMLNGEGGAIPEEQRSVNLFDRVDTTASTWMGLTMGCARCHDHKYDPLTQRDYYSMMAYFNNVPESGVPSGSGQYRIAEPFVFAGDASQMKEVAAAEEKLARAQSEEKRYLATPEFDAAFLKWSSEKLNLLKAAEDAKIEFSTWRDLGTFKAASFEEAFEAKYAPELTSSFGGAVATLKDGIVSQFEGENTAFYFYRTIKAELPNLRSSEPLSYLFSIGSDDGVVVWLNGERLISKKVARAALADQELLTVTLKPGENHLLIKIVNGGGIGGFYFKAYPGGVKDDVAALLRTSDPKLRAIFAAELNLPARKLLADVDRLKANLPRVMVMSDARPRETHIFSRGNYEEPLEVVKPSPPAFLKAEAKSRLELAKWIVSPSNPLTARVQVNRAWQLFFGRGLVRSEENFGVKGEPPTHPELLDWLAVDFQANDWDVKRLHKQIVMSATYRQSSKLTPSLLKRDPANMFFARAPRFRLPSPLLRDIALASSGLLVKKIGGRPVYPYQPKEIWDGLAITRERDFTYPQSSGADNHRRSLYTFWRRTVAPGNMFDSSSRQVCTVKPSLTSTPLHALTMMNDVTWVEAGRALAESVLAFKTDSARLSEAFRRVCSRQPTSAELGVLLKSLARANATFAKDPSLAAAYLKSGNSKQSTPELAALAAVCLAIYNLDEAMTRE